MQDFWQYTLLNNTMRQYVLFVIVFVAGIAVSLVVKHVLLKWGRKWAASDGAPIKISSIDLLEKYLMPVFYFLVFYVSIRVLTLSGMVSRVFHLMILASVVILSAIYLSKLLVFIFTKYWERKKSEGNQAPVRWVSIFIKIIIWVLAVLLFADNAGIKLTAAVTGLGLGGIALAFAAQEVLKDIFCYFSIFFDRPFEVGDMIAVEQHSGTVEHIGIKTTRLRSISGEELIFSNKDLTDSRVKNYRSLRMRRVLFQLNVSYETPNEKLQLIPQLVRDVIYEQRDTRFDRAYFMAFGEYSLIYEVAYYVFGEDYEKYIGVQQAINLGIKKSFEEHEIAFACREAGLLMSTSKET